ncbi:MAG: Bcr/CflA family drug resistance efflux transporter [Xanthomonas sp.]|nr:Bcr/CflA family drug resistance efflux transporter [Xanthomonas sp.]
MRAQHQTQAHHHHGLAATLAALSALGPFATDTYLPSLQEIGRVFEAPPLLVQQTLTAYMLTFALMTLWQGAISDALGRRRVTLAMLGVFFVASIGCMLSWSIGSLMFFRALQGMSAGAGMVIGRAIVRDVLDGAEAQRLMARVALTFAIAPALGPVVGGWLHVWFGWRSVFAFLALYAGGLLWWCARELPETLPPAQRQPLRVGFLLRSYGGVLKNGPFVALVLAVTLNFSAVFVYIMSAPAFLLNLLRVEETDFLWLFGPITAGMMIGTWLSSQLAGQLSSRRTLVVAYGFMAVAAGANLILHLLQPPSLPWSVLPLAVYVVGSSLAMPSLTLLALDCFPKQRGLAASCQGFVQSAGNVTVTALIAPALWGSAVSLAAGQAVLFAGAAAACALALWLGRSGAAAPGSDKHAVGV